ncbi:hypothetical protein ACEXQE_02320 [Herbiconiux sp. P17]|uniref:hypothetical protein n=1 Tax=Herbiconiux wuyangfengii TaxID=3342794 RepID=UPI0035B86B90
MSDESQPTAVPAVKVEEKPHYATVKGNGALVLLYVWGGILTGAGFLTAGIATGLASSEITSYDPSVTAFATASAFQSIGIVAGGLGIIGLFLAAAANAVNWQITNTFGK